MRVKAIRDHEHAGTYRKAGDEFEHTGKLHEHIKEVKTPAVKTDDEEGDGEVDQKKGPQR